MYVIYNIGKIVFYTLVILFLHFMSELGRRYYTNNITEGSSTHVILVEECMGGRPVFTCNQMRRWPMEYTLTLVYQPSWGEIQ